MREMGRSSQNRSCKVLVLKDSVFNSFILVPKSAANREIRRIRSARSRNQNVLQKATKVTKGAKRKCLQHGKTFQDSSAEGAIGFGRSCTWFMGGRFHRSAGGCL